MTSEEAVTFSPTLKVYCDVILAMPINSVAVSSPSLSVHQYNKCDMNLRKQNCFSTITLNFIWLNFLSMVRNSGYLFSKRWNWQICHIHPAFKFPLHTFSSKLQTFPTVKTKTIGFLLNRTQQYTPVLFLKFRMSYFQKKSC